MSDSANCKDTQRLIERLRDLLVQATKEKSHFYVARCVRDAINALEAMQARVAELEKLLALPYPPNDGKTHWENCYLDRGHHNCAVQRIAELESALREIANGCDLSNEAQTIAKQALKDE